MRTVKKCPVCGSTNIEIVDSVRDVFVPFTVPIKQKQRVCYCKSKDCSAPILLWSESSKVIKNRIFAAAKKSIPNLLDQVNCLGYSDSRIERALYLKEGSVKKWKLGKEITPEIVALIRFLYSYPESIEFAEGGFVKKPIKISTKSVKHK